MEAQVRPALRQRISRRRRQSASADSVRRQRSGAVARAEAFGGEILELCVAVGGTITGEHGVGVEKIDQMCVAIRPATSWSRFIAVKRAFDPAGLLNPGKAVPTLHRCAEFGGMHVRAGRAKQFPELAAILMLRACDRLSRVLQRSSREAAAHRTPLRIRGGGTKDFYGGAAARRDARHRRAIAASSITSRPNW